MGFARKESVDPRMGLNNHLRRAGAGVRVGSEVEKSGQGFPFSLWGSKLLICIRLPPFPRCTPVIRGLGLLILQTPPGPLGDEL